MFVLLVGCTDEQAAEHERTRMQLVEAIGQVASADRGFVPKGAESQTDYLVGGQATPVKTADLATYRQEMLTKPTTQLEAVLAGAPDAEHGSARRLLADLQASRIRHRTHEAMLQWAGLSGKQATLLRYLAAVEWADSRQRRLLQDDPSEQIDVLRKQKAATKTALDALEKQSALVQAEVEKLTLEINRLHDAAGKALARSQKFQADAMVAKGSQRYAIYEQGTKEQRSSDKQTAAAQVLEVKRDVRQSELYLLKVRSKLARQQIKGQEERLNFEEQRLNETKEKLLETEAAKAQAVQTLVAYHNSIAQAYSESVDAVMRSAVEELIGVIGLVDKAAAGGRGGIQKQGILLEKLGYLMEQIYVLSTYAMVTGDYGQKLSLVADQAQRIMPEQSKSFSTTLEHVMANHEDVVNRSGVVMEKARALVEELKAGVASADHPIALLVADQAKRLEGYDRSLQEFKSDGARASTGVTE